MSKFTPTRDELACSESVKRLSGQYRGGYITFIEYVQKLHSELSPHYADDRGYELNSTIEDVVFRGLTDVILPATSCDYCDKRARARPIELTGDDGEPVEKVYVCDDHAFEINEAINPHRCNPVGCFSCDNPAFYVVTR